uniref:Uncharacterized protein n=1 Tax=Anopheles arabiensis TaxID=7173 RepID=A0A182IGE5_ANOAR
MNASSVAAAGCGCEQECYCRSLAVENNRKIHILTNLTTDLHMKLDELLAMQRQHPIQPLDTVAVIVQGDQTDGFVFAKISDKNELAKFEADLMLTERFSFIKTWLLKKLKSVGSIPRMHEALYIIFNRVFFNEVLVEWTRSRT